MNDTLKFAQRTEVWHEADDVRNFYMTPALAHPTNVEQGDHWEPVLLRKTFPERI